ncbi:MAG: hypothetical protein ABGZ17_08605 [Planctomycetaceae bacterium]
MNIKLQLRPAILPIVSPLIVSPPIVSPPIVSPADHLPQQRSRTVICRAVSVWPGHRSQRQYVGTSAGTPFHITGRVTPDQQPGDTSAIANGAQGEVFSAIDYHPD